MLNVVENMLILCFAITPMTVPAFITTCIEQYRRGTVDSDETKNCPLQASSYENQSKANTSNQFSLTEHLASIFCVRMPFLSYCLQCLTSRYHYNLKIQQRLYWCLQLLVQSSIGVVRSIVTRQNIYLFSVSNSIQNPNQRKHSSYILYICLTSIF